jgi:glycosyltransferase involved in cell wall biosynthesis
MMNRFNLVYVLKRSLDKLLSSFRLYQALINSCLFSGGDPFVDREAQDDATANAIKKIRKKRLNGPSISAIYRVKNAEVYLESSLLSVAPLVKEVIIIDNMSTDNTLGIARRLKAELAPILRIEVYSYGQRLELAGEGYLERVEANKEGSLAKFYNYCFSLGTADYLLKVDAHYIFTIKGLLSLQKQVGKGADIIYYRGCEIYGKALSVEPHCFRRAINFQYIDSDRFEILKIEDDQGLVKKFIFSPAFLHLKRISYSKHLMKSQKPLYSLYGKS